MPVCATCRQPGITPGEHACPGPRYEDVVFTRHRGHAITVDTAPPRTRIALQAFADRYAYLHMPAPDRIVFADQVVYQVTGYADGALELELVEDWRPAPTVQLPLTDEQAEEIKTRWKERHGNGQAVHPVVVLNEEKPAD
jgi:aminoglycoside/choline kinase family phosphotransferase